MLEVGCLASLAWVYPEVAALRLRAPDRQGEEGEEQQPGRWHYGGDRGQTESPDWPYTSYTSRHPETLLSLYSD